MVERPRALAPAKSSALQRIRPRAARICALVLDGLALSGGFHDFAKLKRIYVLRGNADGSQQRIPFNYKQVIAGKKSVQNVPLQSGDMIVVP